ncbi:hypothetical protein GOODEAATRI_010648 [Goodea atripinnis]|uniref:Uncharacterized protein n=1 Tax=Goodea atripinnis TaxID=208336 RepID=A0ABV0P337_9TELE
MVKPSYSTFVLRHWPLASILVVPEGKHQLVLVGWVYLHRPEAIRHVHCGEKASISHLSQLLVQVNHGPA